MILTCRTLSLIVLLSGLTISIQAQGGFGCQYTWSAGEKITFAPGGMNPSANPAKASTNDQINLSVFFHDREQVKGLCLVGSKYYKSSPTSVYQAAFHINQPNFASFESPTISLQDKTVNVKLGYSEGASGVAPIIVLGTDIYENLPVTLFFRPAWAPHPVTGTLPGPVVVTVTVTDITPLNTVPAGDLGNCLDPAPNNSVTHTWTFNYSSVCPGGLSRTPGTSPNNTWINFVGDHDLQRCYPTGIPTEDVPFCYKAIPDIPPVGSDYTGRLISEEFGIQQADFDLGDLRASFRVAHPELITLEDFAAFIFVHSSRSSFSLDAMDKFEDDHGPNALFNRTLMNAAFTPPAINAGKVGYHFVQDYKCNNVSILNATLHRRIEAAPSLNPQLKKVH